MKNSSKKGKREEEVADKAINPAYHDVMKEIKEFVRKKQLQNHVLKKLSESMESTLSEELNKPKSA
jgi:hypothetical protein